jgi:REP element-mobilizing transposase RayT
MSNIQLPQRKKLPHNIPAWVPDGARYFITINCRARGRNQLCKESVATALLTSVDRYAQLGHWYPWLFIVMPDHVHLIASINRAHGLRRIIAAWKSYQAKQLGIVWQAGFFEHRLRTADEFVEKAVYIRRNPVRKGLATDEAVWPYLWERPQG